MGLLSTWAQTPQRVASAVQSNNMPPTGAFYWLSADGDLCTYSISHRDGMGTVRLGSQLRHAQSPPRHIGLFGSHRV